MSTIPGRLLASALVCLSFAATSPGGAADVAGFYKGRQVSLIIASPPGGGYDAYGRLVGRYIGEHIPGQPTIIVKNMDGAGGLIMMNYVTNIAPQDGSVIGGPQNGTPFEPVFHIISPDGKNAKFDAAKLHWLGSATRDIFLPFVWYDVKVNTIADLQSQPLVFGGGSPGSDNATLAVLLNRVFDAKLKIVTGYSSAQVMIALQRGEVQGVAGMPYTTLAGQHNHLLVDKKLKFLMQIGSQKHPAYPEVPLIYDLMTDEDKKKTLRLYLSKYEVSRPYFVGPGVPADRVAALRAAFAASMADPELLAQAAKTGLEINLVPGEEAQAVIEQVYETPEAEMVKVRDLVRME